MSESSSQVVNLLASRQYQTTFPFGEFPATGEVTLLHQSDPACY